VRLLRDLARHSLPLGADSAFVARVLRANGDIRLLRLCLGIDGKTSADDDADDAFYEDDDTDNDFNLGGGGGGSGGGGALPRRASFKVQQLADAERAKQARAAQVGVVPLADVNHQLPYSHSLFLSSFLTLTGRCYPAR
jgi:hypothetical protein